MNFSLTPADHAFIKQSPDSIAAKYIREAAAGKPLAWIDRRIVTIAVEIFFNCISMPGYATRALLISLGNRIARYNSGRQVVNHMSIKLENSLHSIKLLVYAYFRSTKTANEFNKFEDQKKILRKQNETFPFFKKLPNDIQNHILNYLEGNNLEKLPTVCQDFKAVLEKPEAIAIRLANIEETKCFKKENLEQFVSLAVKAGDKLKELDPGPNLPIDGKMLAQIIKSCPNIEKMTLCWRPSEIVSNDFALFKELKHLKHLKIDYLSCVTKQNLEDISQCAQLTHLDLGNYTLHAPIYYIGEGFELLSKLKNLEYLNVSNLKKFDDDALKHVSTLKKLKHLDMSGCEEITDKGFSYLSEMSELRHLSARFCLKLTHAGFSHLTGLLQLETLSISSCKITDTGLQHLSNLSELTHLELSHCGITSAGLVHIKTFTKMKHLDLSDNNIDQSGWDSLKYMKSLEHLNVSFTYCGRKGLIEAAKIGFPNLKHLNLFETDHNDDDLILLQSFPLLEELDIGHNYKILGPGLQHLASLKFLKYLNLTYSNINLEGLKHLKSLSLEHLKMQYCPQIQNEELKAIAEIQTLKILDLTDCNYINDESLKYLYPMVNLKELHLPWNYKGLDDIKISRKAIRELLQNFPPYPQFKFYPGIDEY